MSSFDRSNFFLVLPGAGSPWSPRQVWTAQSDVTFLSLYTIRFSLSDTNPTPTAPFSLKNHLKVLFPEAFSLRIKASTCTFGGHKSPSSAYALLEDQRESLKAARESAMIVQRNKSQKTVEIIETETGYSLKRRKEKANYYSLRI